MHSIEHIPELVPVALKCTSFSLHSSLKFEQWTEPIKYFFLLFAQETQYLFLPSQANKADRKNN